MVVQPSELGSELGRGLEAERRIRFETPRHDPAERRRHFGGHRVNRLGGVVHALVELVDSALCTALSLAPGKHVVDDQTQGVNVCALIDFSGSRLLRSHVLQGSDDGSVDSSGVESRGARGAAHRQHDRVRATTERGASRAGDAEIHDDGLALVAHHDVAGLEIAVDDTLRVCSHQPGHNRPHDRERSRYAERAQPVEQDRQLGPLDVLHGDVFDPVDFAEIVDAHDVLVRDLARQNQLALETRLDGSGSRRIGHHFRTDDLERHDFAELGVVRLVDGSHTTDAKQPDDVIAGSERLPRCQRPGVGGTKPLDTAKRFRFLHWKIPLPVFVSPVCCASIYAAPCWTAMGRPFAPCDTWLSAQVAGGQ